MEITVDSSKKRLFLTSVDKKTALSTVTVQEFLDFVNTAEIQDLETFTIEVKSSLVARK